MRYLDRSKLAQGLHRATVRRAPVWLSLFTGVSALAMMAAEPAHAQDAMSGGDFAVDVSDPSISIDLSVLEDGGASSASNLPMSPSIPSKSGAYQMPGADMPVSTLYIQPSEGLTLPQQTKTLIAKPAPEIEPTTDIVTDIAEDTSMPEAPALEESESVAEAIPDALADAPAPEETAAVEHTADEPTATPEVAAPAAPEEQPQETAKIEPEPAPAPEAKPEPEPEVAVAPTPTPALPPAQETVEAEPAPAPEPAQVKDVVAAEPTPEPMPTPEATPAPEVAAAAEAQVPPPPQALTQTPPQAAPAQQEAAPAAPGAVVVDLPPKLEEQQPGVASLPSATGPLSDGDTMRIVFEHDSSKLPSDVRDALKSLSDRLSQQETLRLQLLAYAGDDDTSASAARRLSLSRALAVRSYLIENGVRSTRIDVRALGNKSTEAVTERVDITIVER